MNYQSEAQIRKLLQEATVSVRVLNSEGIGFSSTGTGFFVAPNLILTCAHVVNNIDDSKIIVYIRRTDTNYLSVVQYINQDTDIALLSINYLTEDYSCVYLDDSQPAIHDSLYSYGYPNNDYSNGESTTFLYEGESYKNNILVYKLKSGEVDFGASGSPVLNLRTGTVSCMVGSSRYISTDIGARAVPSLVILESIPKLRISHNKYHFYNRKWRKYLPHDIEATDLDWEILNSYHGLWNYFKVVWVLFKALIVWIVFGRLVNNSFPIGEVLSIFWENRNGYLGDKLREISCSLKIQSINSRDITQLTSEQLNFLESQYWLIVEVIEVASPKDVCKEISRIFYTVESFEEERTKIIETQIKTDKQFKHWNKVRQNWVRFFNPVSNRLSSNYKKTEKILNHLIFEYVEGFIFVFKEVETILDAWNHDIPKNLNVHFLYSKKLINILANLVSDMSDWIDISTSYIQYLLNKSVKENPTLKILLKTKILIDFAVQRDNSLRNSMINKPPIRIRTNITTSKNKYHFHIDCEHYPKIELEGEEVLCFDNIQDAERAGYEPCVKCQKKKPK